jgi:signal transduction histidine kinase
MNGILGFAELLKEPDLTGETQREYIGIIEKSGQRMLNILNDIVSISKIESGLMEVNIQETDINEQIGFIHSFFKLEIEGKGIRFLIKTPLKGKEAYIQSDSEKIYGILTNIIKNAVKFTHEGTIELGYQLKTEKEPSELEFYVKDTGIGVPKDRQKQIFDRFIQADVSGKMAYQGAGLGLSISKAYAELLGGKIWMESEEGKGSVFYFTLPYLTERKEKNIT